ncbi:MAG: heme exporter protein CcmB [Myxococcales bacterium]|nr:heme exporter protein CcmB [Myxococcales bacterium]
MSLLKAAWLIAAKDLRIEMRTKETVLTTSLFGVLVVVLASLSFYIDPITSRRVAPGVLWVAIAFSGVLAMGRAWAYERENDVMRALLLSPAPRAAIFAGKAIGSLVLMLAIEAILVPLVALFFQVDLTWALAPALLVIVLGTVGFVAVGTLFSVLTVRSRARDLMLSVLIFPLITPALLSSVVATRELLDGATLGETLGWLQILLAFDVLFVTAGAVLFEVLVAD